MVASSLHFHRTAQIYFACHGQMLQVRFQNMILKSEGEVSALNCANHIHDLYRIHLAFKNCISFQWGTNIFCMWIGSENTFSGYSWKSTGMEGAMLRG